MGKKTNTDKISDLNREVGEVKTREENYDERIDNLSRAVRFQGRLLFGFFSLWLADGVSMKASGNDVVGAVVNAVVAVAEAVQAVVSAAG